MRRRRRRRQLVLPNIQHMCTYVQQCCLFHLRARDLFIGVHSSCRHKNKVSHHHNVLDKPQRIYMRFGNLDAFIMNFSAVTLKQQPYTLPKTVCSRFMTL